MIPITVVVLVGMLFATMAVMPLLLEESTRQPMRQRHLVLVHSSDVPAPGDRINAA